MLAKALPSVSALLVMALASPLPAWALYKVVGPDGQVTYTDRAPNDQAVQALRPDGSTAPSQDVLPYELQKTASRYPVILFTSPACAPCDAGRQMLQVRGIPFAEKTVVTAEDVKALLRKEGTAQLPVLRIGQKQLLGYGATEWASYLDAAGYPATSALPLNYRWPQPTPLVPAATQAPAPAKPEVNTHPPRSTPASGDNTPPGFRF